jgi:alpha-D-xyloside xylohydrolase
MIDTARNAEFYFQNLELARNIDDTVESTFGQSLKDAIAVALGSDGKETVPAGRVVSVDVPAAQGVDVYVFGGPTMRLAVQRYNLFSGGGVLPPIWGLGVQYQALQEFNAQQCLNLAKVLRSENMPCDVFGLEPGWHSRYYPCSYDWSEERWPDPAGFMKEMTDMNYKVSLWEQSFISPASSIYKAMKKHSGDYLVWGGLVPDFGSKKGREIFFGHHDKNLVAKGIAAFKMDACEDQPLATNPAWGYPPMSSFPSGFDGELAHNLNMTTYQKELLEIFQKHNKRTYSAVRSSHAMASPFPFVLFTDHYDSREFVRGIATCGFSGMLFQPDLRTADSVDEFYRRLQMSVFSPQCLINGWWVPNPYWWQINREKNHKDEFLPNRKEVTDACRELLELRMSLIPYLYSSFADYYYKGIPPFRALVMDWPDDPETHKIDDQYMMGSSIMVAPVFPGQNKKSVYLPKGKWHDFETGKLYEGGKRYEVSKASNEVLAFVKSGSLIPLAKPKQYANDGKPFDITVYQYGSGDAEFVLYEDDGLSYDFAKKNQQNRLFLSKKEDSADISINSQGNYTGPKRYRIIDWRKK